MGKSPETDYTMAITTNILMCINKVFTIKTASILCLVYYITFTAGSIQEDKLLKRCRTSAPHNKFLKAASEWNTCYEFRLGKRTWRSALYDCGDRGGRLVTIRESRVQRFLLRALYRLQFGPREIWLGATDKEKEMRWKWITGENVKDTYSNWARGQPSCGAICIEDCAIMKWREAGGKWHDYHCSWFDSQAYICEYDMDPEVKPSHTTTTTTTTTTPSTTLSTTTTPTSTPAPISTKALESGHLVVGKESDEREQQKNMTVQYVNSRRMPDSNSAHAAGVTNENGSSGFDTGSVAVLIIGILIGLSMGLCIFLLLFRRRRKKKVTEDEPRVCFNNPYYGEITSRRHDEQHTEGDAGPLLASGFNGSNRHIENDETTIIFNDNTEVRACGGGRGRVDAAGYEEPVKFGRGGKSKNTTLTPGTAVKGFHSPRLDRQTTARAMNDYDSSTYLTPPKRSENSRRTPAAASSSRQVSNGQALTEDDASKKARSDRQSHERNKSGNCYEEVGNRPNSKHGPLPPLPSSHSPSSSPTPRHRNKTLVSYKVPKSSAIAGEVNVTGEPQGYDDSKHECDANDRGSMHSNLYANYSAEENIYESLESIRAAVAREEEKARTRRVGEEIGSEEQFD